MIITLPYKPQHSAGPLLVLVIAIVAYFFEPAASEWLAYDRNLLEGFETWRLITGNIVHTNGMHLVLNASGLVLLWALHGDHYRFWLFIRLFIWCAFGTSIGIYFFSPNLIWYAGLSGALHGIFIWGACMDINKGLKSGWLLLIGVVVKVAYEQLYGSSQAVSDLINANVAVDAHLYGALCGIIMFLGMWLGSLKKR